jgi:hypothetical protein
MRHSVIFVRVSVTSDFRMDVGIACLFEDVNDDIVLLLSLLVKERQDLVKKS